MFEGQLDVGLLITLVVIDFGRQHLQLRLSYDA